MSYIQTHGIKFFNHSFKGYVRKTGSPNTDTNLNYIMEFDDPDMLMKIISDLQLAINGNFNEINDPDLTSDNDIAVISASGVNFYDDDGQEIIETVPLQDIYDLAVAWRNFLLQPPLNGTATNQ